MQRKIFGTFRPFSPHDRWAYSGALGVGIGLYILLDYEMTPGARRAKRRRYGQRRVASRAIPLVLTLVMLIASTL